MTDKQEKFQEIKLGTFSITATVPQQLYFFSPAEVLTKGFSRSKTTLSLRPCCGDKFSSTQREGTHSIAATDPL